MTGSISLIDRLRVLLLLEACEAADMIPIPIMRFHAIAYLANVLSPVWTLHSHDGKVLKRQGGPYYPELQHELDALVGIGLVTVHDLTHVCDEGSWRMEGKFRLNSERADVIINQVKVFSDENRLIEFFRRLTYALKRIKTPVEALVAFDATWADGRTGTGDVIDFSEWRAANYSAYTAEYFSVAKDDSVPLTQGEKLQLYLRLLEQRAHASVELRAHA